MASTFSTRLPPSLTNGLASARHCILTLPTVHFRGQYSAFPLCPAGMKPSARSPASAAPLGQFRTSTSINLHAAAAAMDGHIYVKQSTIVTINGGSDR